MDKLKKIVFLLGAGIALASCSEEDIATKHPVVTGDEINFGISAGISTRTIYGDVNESKDKIAINWLEGDQIEIACPEAAQAKKATYKVAESIENGNFNSNEGISKAETLERVSDVGLQWSSEATHNFYATYPSQQELEAANIGATVQMDANGMQCFLPMTQTPKQKTTNESVTTLEPDMRYAFMVANTQHTDKTDNTVALRFEPVITALQFELGVNDLVNAGKSITITGLQLSSNTDICGNFSYKFSNRQLESNNPATESFNHINMENINVQLGTTGNDKLNFTFFLLPVNDINNGALKLHIFYEIDGSPRVRVATVNKDIIARKKYFFKDLIMEINGNLKGSSWFSALDDNIYLSQVSIPGAGNVFSNYATSEYHKEQVTDYLTLWNRGVRCFELTTGGPQDGTPSSSYALSDFAQAPFICGEEFVQNGNNVPRFGETVESLINMFKNTSEFKDECLILICRYHAKRGGYRPDWYLNGKDGTANGLLDYLDNLVSSGKVTKNDFVQLNSSSTVGDLKGKIAIIIRPGDDAYMNSKEFGCPDVGGTANLSLGSWQDKVMLVQDWGAAYDRWDKRYAGVAREATWDENNTQFHVEDYLYGISKSNKTFDACENFKTSNFTELTDDESRFAHTVTGFGGKVYIQEWARVVSSQNDNVMMATGDSKRHTTWGSHNDYLWVKWPESATQKKGQIDDLFKKSIRMKGTVGTDLYINVLSGYYTTKNHRQSITPFKYQFGGRNIQPNGQGNGGNYAALAADLNAYVYDKLKNNIYGVGPYGIVMMDYLFANTNDFTTNKGNEFSADLTKAQEASANLVELIWKNNFKFPMAVKPGTGGGSNPGESAETISWSTSSADPNKDIK